MSDRGKIYNKFKTKLEMNKFSKKWRKKFVKQFLIVCVRNFMFVYFTNI